MDRMAASLLHVARERALSTPVATVEQSERAVCSASGVHVAPAATPSTHTW